MKRLICTILGLTLWCVVSKPPLLAQDATSAASEVHGEKAATTAPVTSEEASTDGGSSAGSVPTLRIAAGDLLAITLFETDYSCTSDRADKTGCEVRVSDSGAIVLPLIGEVKVAGLTVAQAEQVIAARFTTGGYFNNPQVSVVQKEYSTQGISVLGEVQKPGIYPLLGSHTLLQAISAAGGTTAKAGNEVKLIHPDHLNKAEHVDLSSAGSSSVLLRPGDTVIVSKAGIVYVVGDVKQPTGIVMESSGLTVLKAIAMAQGTNSTASLKNAKLIRNGPSGHQEIPVSLTKILSNQAEDIKLQPEDVLFVPNSAAKSAARRSLEAILQTATGVAIYGRY